MEPTWINDYDYAGICPAGTCHIEDIRKIYSIDLTIGNGNNVVVKLNFFETCILLEEGIGDNPPKLKTQIKEYPSTHVNSGFQAILAFAYEDKDLLKSEDEDIYFNIADINLGATCTSTATTAGYECETALRHVSNYVWLECSSISDSRGTCIGHYIDILFPFPVQPQFYCLSIGLYQSTGSEMEFWQCNTINPVEDRYRHCYNYTFRPTIESGVRGTIKALDLDADATMKVFQMYVLKRTRNIYTISDNPNCQTNIYNGVLDNLIETCTVIKHFPVQFQYKLANSKEFYSRTSKHHVILKKVINLKGNVDVQVSYDTRINRRIMRKFCTIEEFSNNSNLFMVYSFNCNHFSQTASNILYIYIVLENISDKVLFCDILV
ncbi:DgyrCDS14628 [Dimorphilus gyrociliatus]|uniref:DgyrCDS14628 n=1 Tax=Dimorphilus gyrociliatus TaxID=2664684 RepID=A0A7I8WEA8_9ANNE|nr:DgyrCDS14628 [Dimorphilus gyrociliatus]